MADYGKFLGSKTYDNLVSDTNPAVKTAPGSLKRLGTAGTIKRGTILAKGSDGNLIVLGSDIDATGTFSATGDGSKKEFNLASAGKLPIKVDEVKVDGTAVTTGFNYYPETGLLIFDTAPANTKAVAVKFTTGGAKAFGILCDDTAVGTSAEVSAAVYVQGCFNLASCIVATGYTITDADKAALRDGGVFFKAEQA